VGGYYVPTQSLSFSPDGGSVFIVGDRILDVKTGERVTALSHAWKGFKVLTHNPVSGQYHPNGRYVLMTLADATVRIYDAKTGEEVAMLIGFEDGEWLVITSEGYYNSSEKGAHYLSVKVGETSYTVERFYDVFYRPDIVAAKLRGEDVRGLVTITMKDAIKSPPPDVEITPLQETDKAKVKICYQVKSAGGAIGEVRLFHGGKLIKSDGYYREVAKSTGEATHLAALNSRAIYEDIRGLSIKSKADVIPITSQSKGEVFKDCEEIDAIPGGNEVSVAAFNGNNTVQSSIKTIHFNSRVPPQDAHLYILSIGVDEYEENSVNLKYAMKDAKDLGEKLKAQAGTLYKPENVHYMLLTNREATKANILRQVDELARIIKPNDSFIFYEAGHGVLLQNQYYILTHDYNGRVSGSTMISSNEIVEMSKKIKSLSQLFIFDTCHAGGVDYIVSGLYDARLSVLAKKMGLHIYASASDKQAALDGYKGNGLFTYSLLQGLNNNKEVDKNSDGKVSLVELGGYVRQATADLSKEVGHSQTPFVLNFGQDTPIYQLR
jgi:WD40 repeat protein